VANIFGSLRAVGRIVQVGRLVIIILFFVEKIIKNGADILQLIAHVNGLFYPEKLGPLGQVIVLRRCLEVLFLKSQIPSTKSQINLRFQYSMTKIFQGETLFGFSNFGHWKSFDICNLIFGISISQ